MPVTQQNIADHLGLSKMSVVRALNGQPKVSEATRRLVLETASELGYSQNSNPEARMLIARRYGNRVRHGVLGVLLPEQQLRSFPYYVQLLEGMRRGAREAGVELMLLDMASSPSWNRVDGVIGPDHTFFLPPDHVVHSLPRIATNFQLDGLPSVVGDDFGGAKMATEHLIELGHRRIAYLIDMHTQNAVSVQRVNGYRAALEAAGIEAEDRWVGPLVIDAAPFLKRGRDSMNRWLAADWKQLGCTALLVQNDRAAMGALDALQNSGIRVPDDVSVVGFDGTDECELTKPSLTSVRVPLEEIGAQAVTLLLQQINEEEGVSKSIVLPVTLEERGSTGPPKPGSASIFQVSAKVKAGAAVSA